MSRTVTVTTGARLHFGPLSYRPETGRHFGGVGIMLDEPGFRLAFRAVDRDAVIDEGTATQRVREFVSQYRQACAAERQPPACEVTIERAMPSHNGLGSGTQLGLAVARGLAALADEDEVSVTELARRVGRGRRSAVGLYGFDQGGLIVDAGQSQPGELGALACRLPLPVQWPVLLITPRESGSGLSGAGEERAFDQLSSMPASLTDRLCRIVLTQLLPAVQGRAFDEFSRAVDEYGRRVGEFFAPVQGGTYGSPQTDALIARLRERGIVGTGQTSWGPTVFAFVEDGQVAEQLASELRAREPVDVQIIRLRNEGAAIEQSRAR